MGIISELKFLEKDKRFRQILDPKELEKLDWYLNFDRFIYDKINELTNLIKKKDVTPVIEFMNRFDVKCGKEIFFLGKIRKFARGYNLKKELILVEDSMRRLQKILNILGKAKPAMWRKGEVNISEKDLKDIKRLL